MMSSFRPDATDSMIERVLELSAEAQIKKRQTAEDSTTFHNLAGAIAAYGRVLRLLARLQEVQETHFLTIGHVRPLDAGCTPGPV